MRIDPSASRTCCRRCSGLHDDIDRHQFGQSSRHSRDVVETASAVNRSTNAWPTDRTPLDLLVEQVIASGVVESVTAARMVTDGMQHVVVLIDDRLVARFARDAAAADSLHAEATLLGAVAGQVSAPLASPIHVASRFTVHEMLHGEVTTRAALARLTTEARCRLIDDVGRFLSEMGRASVAGLAPSPATSSLDRFRRLRARADRLVAPLLWAHQRTWYEELFAAVERTSFEQDAGLIHGDLAPYHMLHDPATGRLTGVLDFGVAGVGDPAVDLACLISTWGETFTTDLVRTWPWSQDLLDRARLIAVALPLDWATIALESDASDMAVAHLGHLAPDIRPSSRP
jgi:aminoglycoside 2''-phosphotransferase